MTLRFIDKPVFVEAACYQHELHQVVDELAGHEGILSIFQIGNVNHPGISDIDLLVVFEDDCYCSMNPLRYLSKTGRYLFTHNVFGISESHFKTVHKFTLYHNYKLLQGKTFKDLEMQPSTEGIPALKVQTALEFLVKNYIDLTVQLTYGIIKTRVLLQHLKGIRYDLEFLGVTTGKIVDLLQQALEWINNWFALNLEKNTLVLWIRDFYSALFNFLKNALNSWRFFVPHSHKAQFACNIRFVPSTILNYTHRGIVLPMSLAGLGRRYFNLQHRLNNFMFEIPVQPSPAETLLAERFEFLRSMKRHVLERFPHFSPPVPAFTNNIL